MISTMSVLLSRNHAEGIAISFSDTSVVEPYLQEQSSESNSQHDTLHVRESYCLWGITQTPRSQRDADLAVARERIVKCSRD
jgi:hypothetical protein